MEESIQKKEVADLVGNDINLRNRRILMEFLGGKNVNEIAMRYGISTSEIERCLVNGFDDAKTAEFHKEIRTVLVSNIVKNIQRINDWMEHLSPKRKRFHQQVDMKNEKVDLWEEVDDNLSFIKFETELRNQYALMAKILGAEMPEEEDRGKEKIQKKMLDALSMSLSLALQERKANNARVERTILDVEKIEDPVEEEKDGNNE